MRLRSGLRALTAAIPARVHYRPSDNPSRECATCAYDENGTCTMFDATVEPTNVCDEWTPIKSDLAVDEALTAALHNKAILAADKRALALEDKLVDVLTPILEEAGRNAARLFSQATQRALHASTWHAFVSVYGKARLRDSLTAAGDGGVTSASTMIAVKPRPEEAAQIAANGGADADTLHVTLAFLGQTEGDLEDVAAALRPVAANLAPLVGVVGGIGAFNDNGNGYPILLLPSVPGLVELRVATTEALVEQEIDFGRNHGWVPHMTIDYVQDRDPDDDGDVDDDDVDAFASVGIPLHFDELLIVRGDNEVISLPLIGTPPLTASGPLERADRMLVAMTKYMMKSLNTPIEPVPDRLVFTPLRGGELAAALENDAIVDEIAEVAEAHAPDGGYGETAWNPATKTVFWVSADWSTTEEIAAAEEAFLAIDGVDNFEEDAECALPDGEDWEPVLWRSLRAAGDPPPPDWTQPSPNKILDVDALVKQLRGVTDPVRQAVVESVMKDTLAGVKAPPSASALVDALKAINQDVRGGEDRRGLLAEASTGLDNMVRAGWLTNAQKIEVIGSWVSPDFQPNDVDLLVSVDKLTDDQRELMKAVTGQGDGEAHPFGNVHVMFTSPTDPVFNDDLAQKFRDRTDKRYDVKPRTLFDESNSTGIAWDVTNPFTAKVLAQAGSQVTSIADTTRLNVMKVISASYKNGLSIPDTAKAIQAGMSEAAPIRARLIARTELAGAVNGGSLAAVQIVSNATGETYKKTWLTAPGAPNPRHEDYEDLDGQEQPLNGYFDVGGFNLQHPGDPDGPPSEVCNCRCTMTYDGGGGGEEEDDSDSGE